MAYRVIFTMLSLIIAFNLVLDWYFFKRAICRFTTKKWIRVGHWISSFLLMLLNIWIAYNFTSPTTSPTSTFYIWSMLLLFLIYIPKGFFMIFSWPELFLKEKTIFSTIGIIIGCSVSILYLWGASFGRFNFRTNKITINSETIPTLFEHFKIVQFSDTHLGNLGESEQIIAELVNRINAERADLIVFTGDLVNTRANEIDKFAPLLRKLSAKEGVISILGNHDYGDYVFWANEADHKADFKKLIEKENGLGWRLLRNETIFLKRGNDSIQITGVENWGDSPEHNYTNMREAISNTSFRGFKLLLSHNPNHWNEEILEKYDFDLTLSGHTHAMQMAIKIGSDRFSPAVFKYKNWGGYYNVDNKQLYVNEGIGYVLYPMRIGAGPEITVLTLKNTKTP